MIKSKEKEKEKHKFLSGRQWAHNFLFTSILFTFFITTSAFAQYQKIWFTEQFAESTYSPESSMRLIERDSKEDVYESITNFCELLPAETKKDEYVSISLPGGGSTGKVGKPGLPYYGRFILVPDGVEVKLVIDSVEIKPIAGKHKVFPVQPSGPEVEDRITSDLVIDEKTYSQDKYLFEDEVVQITSDMLLKDKRYI